MPVPIRTRGLPLAAVLAFMPSALVAQMVVGPAGSPGGTPFSDQCPNGVAGVTVRAGWWVDGVQLLCHAGGMIQSHPARGGSGGDGRQFLLNPGETITSLSGAWAGPAGPYIYSIVITTSHGRSASFGHAGTDRGRNAYRLDVPPGQQLSGLTGRGGQYLHAIGLIVGPANTVGAMAMTPQPQPIPMPTRYPAPAPAGKGLAPAPQPGATPIPQPNYTAATPAPAGGGAPIRYEPRAIPVERGGSGSSRFAWCPQAGVVCSDPVGGYRWRQVPVGGSLPPDAMNLSRSRDPWYACRAYVAPEGGGETTQVLGHTQARSPAQCTVAASLGQSFAVREFEVLVGLPDGTTWMDMSSATLPSFYVQAAVFAGESLGLCTSNEAGSTQIGWVSPTSNGCVSEYRGPSSRLIYRLVIRGGQ